MRSPKSIQISFEIQNRWDIQKKHNALEQHRQIPII